jgi:glutamate-ammonia-ligase adenylyltransferase
LGRLYSVDMRLRPTGRSGSLVTPLHEFRRYFAPDCTHTDGCAQLWEKQALTRARVVYGDSEFGRDVMAAVADGVYGVPWRPELIDAILAMRTRLEASRKVRDLKRGFGGLVDVEFLIQAFQLKHGRGHPSLRTPNTWQALDALRWTGLVGADDCGVLRGAYDFLLRVQSRLRIVHNRTLDEVPDAADEIDKLGRRLGFDSGPRFLAQLEQHTTQTRVLFVRLMERERNSGV